jgi:hypothetical protein
VICRFLPVEFGVMQLLCWPTAQPPDNNPFKVNPGEGVDMCVGGGLGLEEELVAHLRAVVYDLVDFGEHELNSEDDYPDFVIPIARAATPGTVECGIAVCGSGVGASVYANKIPAIRAALVHDDFSSRQGVEDGI